MAARIAQITTTLIIGFYLLVRLRKTKLFGVPAYIWFIHIIIFDTVTVLRYYGICTKITPEQLNIWSRGIRMQGVITMASYAITIGSKYGKL